jgi:hypothetical protein
LAGGRRQAALAAGAVADRNTGGRSCDRRRTAGGPVVFRRQVHRAAPAGRLNPTGEDTMTQAASPATMPEQKSDMVEVNEENLAICKKFCGTCPSHDDCAENEFLFCAGGKSANSDNITQKGCNCPEYDVWMDNGLSQMYYCVNGEA